MFIPHLKSKAKIILPENFINKDIAKKYENYLSSTEIDGQAFTNVKDYLSHTLQFLNPGGNLNFESIEQTKYMGKKNVYKSSKKDNFENWPRDITIGFQGQSGYLNYIILLEEIYRKQSVGIRDDHYIDDIIAIHYDMEGEPMIKFAYKFPLFSGLSDVRFDFRNVGTDGEDFELTLSISGVEVERLFER